MDLLAAVLPKDTEEDRRAALDAAVAHAKTPGRMWMGLLLEPVRGAPAS